MSWKNAIDLAQLRKKPSLFKHGRKQLALFLVDDKPFAIDNRCPHEGYPLVEGTVNEECVLTCNWHNWKFRLQDGECILGGDHVRSYPAKIEDGRVWVDVSDPPKEEIEAEILRGLRTAFDKRDFGRMSREIARLHFNDIDPLVAVRQALAWSYDRLEFGSTHAYAAAADWVAQSRNYDSPDDLDKLIVCLTEAVDHIAFDVLRQREFPYAESATPFSSSAFLDAVEKEQLSIAEGMVSRGLEDGLHWADMEHAFTCAALEHYNDFGHSLIYVYKTGQLIDLLGSEVEPYLLPPLARSLCYATREDLIPEFKMYGEFVQKLNLRAGDLDEAPESTELHLANLDKACDWVVQRYGFYTPYRLYDCLLQELAWNMLHFDLCFDSAYDRPVSQNIGWLDFTHGITFANAVHQLCKKYPELWGPGLLQMALFLGRNRPYLDVELDETPWFVDDEPAFWQETEAIMLDHGMRLPIFSAHVIKTAKAVEEELPAGSDSCRKLLLAALNRILHSPIKQKHTRRLARQALALVSRDFENR